MDEKISKICKNILGTRLCGERNPAEVESLEPHFPWLLKAIKIFKRMKARTHNGPLKYDSQSECCVSLPIMKFFTMISNPNPKPDLYNMLTNC